MPKPRRLAEATWPEIAATADRSVLVVPVGSTEQHGPHLPFTVDTDIALALAERLAAARPWVVLAPPVSYGSSGEHAGFPGTLSIGRQATELLLTELGRSADAFAAVAFVSAHGGNAVPVRRAVARLRAEGRRAYFWEPEGDPADSHAGRAETSAMLVLRPGTVRRERAEEGDRRPLPALLPALLRVGLRGVTPNGVLGDPRGARADLGRRRLDGWAADLLTASTRWHPVCSSASRTARQDGGESGDRIRPDR
ncbi:mycofactocin biosynthesis peptidyl-dipeptidase MftE [Streptomyces sp. NBC_00557]|uniref:mycofactocin biosynthesis peptidyl-dipeptidase MftE n=1 Tax=Streptomyces sp. NBC_00557 TaxID=2975776 RepID=UPI002E81A383|nr:mycofactocin biosynthesis peptidyl-dipeptidase MftE [Streptomyces sp. NBC_00557]WUC40197.1 mycofactocin biosynthesis peptidyl-dipeptidase MftE [Streptomyces sp. NBC_00557]